MVRRIETGLKTEIIGKKIVHHNEAKSSQEIAKGLARGGAEEGTIVIVETQTGGKGRRDRRWFSPKGGLYISIIFRPEESPSRSSIFSFLGGVGVAESIQELYGIEAELKWPNDIQIGSKKVGGVLIENLTEKDRLKWMIMGIGLNVNIDISSLPEEFGYTATSLKRETGDRVSKLKLTRKLVEKLDQLYFILKGEGVDEILSKWRQMTNTIGSQVQIKNGDVIEGRALDVDKDGSLLVELGNGELRRINAGDVSLRKIS